MTKPTLVSELMLDANPTASYHDTIYYDDACVSYWRMSSGASLVDEKGANGGTLSGGPALTSSLFPFDSDQAMAFDGTNDYAIVPSSSTLNLAGSWTYEGLVKFASLPGSTRPLFNKGAIRVDLLSSGKVQGQLSNDQSGTLTTTTVTSTSTLDVATAHRLALCWDATLGLLLLYVNGRLESTAVHTVGTELTDAPLVFGARLNGTGPTLRAATSYSGPDNATHTNVIGNKPVGTASGDLLIAQVALRGAVTVTPPTGWDKLGTQSYNSGSGGWNSEVWVRRADGTEGSAFTWTVDVATTYTVGISAWTGVRTDYPFANPLYQFGDTGTHPISTRSHLPGADNTVVLALLTAVVSGSGSNFTWASGTELYDGGSTSLPGPGATAAYLAVGDAAATSLSVDKNTPANITSAMHVLVLNGTGAQKFAHVDLDDWAFLSDALDEDSALDHDEAATKSGTGTWTDVTDDSKGFSSERGRQYELDRIEAGTMSETLADPNRDYDPANTAGAHYPNIKTRRRTRKRATVGASTFDLFYGYVTKWPPNYVGPSSQTVDIAAADGQAALALAPATGTLASDLSGAQVHRLLDLAKWPRDLRDIDAGQFIMAAWELSSTQKALAAIQEIVDSELGLFYINGAGVAVFEDYAHRWTSSRSLDVQVTFSDVQTDIDAGAIPYRFGGIVPSFDDDTTVNHWTVSTADGAEATLQDIVGTRAAFPLSQSRSTRLASVVDAETQALALLQRTARPGERFDTLLANPGSSRVPSTTTAWQAVLGLEISDRVKVIHTPSVGDQIVQDCFVEAIAIEESPEHWEVTFSLSPVSAATFYDTALRSDPVAYYRLDEVT